MSYAALALGLKEPVAAAQRIFMMRVHACVSKALLELRGMLAVFGRGGMETERWTSQEWLLDSDGQCMEPTQVMSWLQRVLAVQNGESGHGKPFAGWLDVEEVEKMARFPGKLGSVQHCGSLAALVTAAQEAARLRQISIATALLEIVLVATCRWIAGRWVAGASTTVDLDYFGSPFLVSSTSCHSLVTTAETLPAGSCRRAHEINTAHASLLAQAAPLQHSHNDNLAAMTSLPAFGTTCILRLHENTSPISQRVRRGETGLLTDPVLAVLVSLEHQVAPGLLFAPLLAQTTQSSALPQSTGASALFGDSHPTTVLQNGDAPRQPCGLALNAEMSAATPCVLPLASGVQSRPLQGEIFKDGSSLSAEACTHPFSAYAPLTTTQLHACARTGDVDALPELSLAFESLSDIAALPCHCRALRCLNLCANHIHDLVPLRPLMQTLCSLNLSENGLCSLGAITSLSALKHLNLDRNQLSTLSGR
jgi:hypothetical protein